MTNEHVEVTDPDGTQWGRKAGVWYRIERKAETADQPNPTPEAQEWRAEANDVIGLCRRLGYGRVMQIAAEAWRELDPVGALTVGPPQGYYNEAAEARIQELETALRQIASGINNPDLTAKHALEGGKS